MTPSQYLYDLDGGYYCLGFGNGTDVVVLGDVFMQGLHVVFDQAHGKVGFGPLSSCPSITSTTGTVPATGQATTTGGSSHVGGSVSDHPNIALIAAIIACLVGLIWSSV